MLCKNCFFTILTFFAKIFFTILTFFCWASPVQVPFWRGVKPWKSGSRGKNDVWGAERCLVCPPRTPKVFPNTFWIDLRKSKKSIFSPFFHRYWTFLRKYDFSEKIWFFSENRSGVYGGVIRGVIRFLGGVNVRAASSVKNNDPARSFLICRGFFFNQHLGGGFSTSTVIMGWLVSLVQSPGAPNRESTTNFTEGVIEI